MMDGWMSGEREGCVERGVRMKRRREEEEGGRRKKGGRGRG